MTGYLLHLYKKGSRPFQSLSALPSERALEIMARLYVEGSVFWERFKDPGGYLAFRKQVEQKLRTGFIAKGGRPKSQHPIYLVVGRPKWFEIEEIIARKGLPGEGWETRMPRYHAHYVEAQAWDPEALERYCGLEAR